MFTSQTSSFQDSIDVEERDDFDSEEISGYTFFISSPLIGLASRFPAFLLVSVLILCPAHSLTLVDSSLPLEAEPELRTYISRRLSKGALLGGMGNIATVELSIPEQAVGCYCCLLEQERSPEQPDADGNGYVICFMGGSEKGLELDKYVQGLHSSLQTPEALSHTHVDVINSDEKTKTDVTRFIKAASLQGLSQQDATTASLCKAISEDTQSDLIIDCSTSPPTLTNTGHNRFCDDWIQAFLNAAERCNPFLLRQILENFKLKAIQDMNSLKRFVRQAEMSHYALFRCCQFLQGCGNGDVLLQNARAEHSDLPEACSIIGVLEEFLREREQAQA
uniref:Chromosome 17 open reading frame 75 n=1 Tax=Acanthochromis polyacanthus TaxID=80966 RepID=A0A3Q1GUJ4_9TELE